MSNQNQRLKWHIGDNLRWLADNKGADYLPCGMLHGSFLVQVAEGYERLVSENRRLEHAAQGIEAATAAETVKLGSVHESPVPKGCAQNLSRRKLRGSSHDQQP